jgi:hypothetical protein
VPRILGRNEKKIDLSNMPKIIRHHKNPQTAQNILSILGKKNPRNFSRVPKKFSNMGRRFVSFPKLPKLFGVVWKSLQCEWFSLGLN